MIIVQQIKKWVAIVFVTRFFFLPSKNVVQNLE